MRPPLGQLRGTPLLGSGWGEQGTTLSVCRGEASWRMGTEGRANPGMLQGRRPHGVFLEGPAGWLAYPPHTQSPSTAGDGHSWVVRHVLGRTWESCRLRPPPGPCRTHVPGSPPRGPGPGIVPANPGLSAGAPGSAAPEEEEQGGVTTEPGRHAPGHGAGRAGSHLSLASRPHAPAAGAPFSAVLFFSLTAKICALLKVLEQIPFSCV